MNSIKSNLDTGKKVESFFDSYSADFFSIYGEKKGNIVKYYSNKIFRKGMFFRFSEVIKTCNSINNLTSILDVGCGPGYHDAILNNKFNCQIHAIDFADSMIKLARNNYSKSNPNIKFEIADFINYKFDQKYDVVFALGVVEYIEDAVSFVKKMISCSGNVVMISLPVKYHFLTPQRIIRYKLRNCPLWFYSISDINNLMKKVGNSNYEVIRSSRDYLLKIYID